MGSRVAVSAIVDDREPSGVLAAVREHPDVADARLERLPAGDLAVGDVGIERKTPSDFVRSALGRTGSDLHDQVRRLREGYEHAYVLVEGDLRDVDERGSNPAAVRGVIASLTARTGVPVIPCSDRERLVDVAIRLGRKHVEAPSADPLPIGAVTGRAEPTPKRMYGCIEGIGPATAAALHEAFPTVAGLAAASVEELRAVEGVGERRARAIREALHGSAAAADD